MARMSDQYPQNNDQSGPPVPVRYNRYGAGMRTIARQLLALFGMFLILIGVPLAILTPFPFVPIGLPVVITGVVLLGRNSLWGRNWMERVIARFPRVERFAPNWLMKAVFGREKRTDL